MHTQEAEGQHATAEVVPELVLDEAGDGLVPPSSLRQEGLELPPDDAVENALLGAAGRVRQLRRTARSAMRMGMTRKGLRFQPEAAVASFMPCSYPAQALRVRSRTPYWEVRGGAFPFRARTPVHTSETTDADVERAPRDRRKTRTPAATAARRILCRRSKASVGTKG